jgi:glycine oxidase
VQTFDVAIVGGGIIGTSCALALAEKTRRVVIFDRQTPGREASYAAGGMLSPAPHFEGDQVFTPLANQSLALYPDFIRSIESLSKKETHFRRGGAIELFFGDAADAEQDREVALCRGLGVEIEAISGSEARRVEPAIASAARAAAYFPAEATVEPRPLMEAALEAAIALGVEIRANQTVQSLIIERARCTGVITGNERVAANHVVIAAGCQSHELFGPAASFGHDLSQYVPTRPVRGQMLTLWPGGTRIQSVVRSKRGYLVLRNQGCVVAGSTLEEAGFEKVTTVEGLNRIRAAAAELVPGLGGAKLGESWSGLRPATPDGLPILGCTGVDGLIVATGHFRNGILLAPITAQLVKDWVTGVAPRWNVELFSPLRFARTTAHVRSAC